MPYIVIELNEVVLSKIMQGDYGCMNNLHNLELPASSFDPKLDVDVVYVFQVVMTVMLIMEIKSV